MTDVQHAFDAIARLEALARDEDSRTVRASDEPSTLERALADRLRAHGHSGSPSTPGATSRDH